MHCNCLIENNLRISQDGILMALDKMCHTLFTGVWCTTGWCQSTRLAESNQWLGGGNHTEGIGGCDYGSCLTHWHTRTIFIHFPHKSNVIFFHSHTPGDGLNMFQIIFDFTCILGRLVYWMFKWIWSTLNSSNHQLHQSQIWWFSGHTFRSAFL